jgi:hypothetical protein
MKIRLNWLILLIYSFSFLFIYCSKSDSPTKPSLSSYTITFKADTTSIKLTTVTARKESIAGLMAIAIDGKSSDTSKQKRSLILRVLGDSARTYKYTEILATYRDASGESFSNITTDTSGKINITKLEKKPKGLIEGSFELMLANTQKNKTILLKEGRFSTIADE